MNKFFIVLVMVSFVLSVSGPSFAQIPSAAAVEKAIENPSRTGGDTLPAAKPDAGKLKAKEEKADRKAKGTQATFATEKSVAEKTAVEKAAEEKAKTVLPK
jgi:hypothetical protein